MIMIQATQDRSLWQCLGETYVHQWMSIGRNDVFTILLHRSVHIIVIKINTIMTLNVHPTRLKYMKC